MLIRFLTIFLIFGSFNTQASGLKNSVSKDFTVFWLRDVEAELDINSIEEAAFQPLTTLINNGFKNGVYWLKIVPKKGLEFNHIFEIPFIHTTDVELYSNGLKIDPRPSTRYILFDLLRKYEGKTLYARVNCKKEALIPIILQQQTIYQQSFNYFSSSSYYIVLLCVLILHLICFYEFGKGTYLNYCFMLITFGSSLAYRDGIFRLFLDPLVHEHIEIFFNLATAYAFAVFTYYFLEHKRYISKYKWWGIALLIIPTISYVVYLYNPTYLLHVITDNLVIVSLGATCCSSLFIYKHTFFAKAFAWAYFPMLLLTINFYNWGFFGIDIGSVDLIMYRIGGIFEMAVFSYVIIYRARKNLQENIQLKVELDFKERGLAAFEIGSAGKKAEISKLESESNEKANSQLASSHQKGVADYASPSKGNNPWTSKSQLLTYSLQTDKEWTAFVERFNQADVGFFDRLIDQWPTLTPAETKLLALARSRLDNKEMALILNVKTDAIRQVKSRARKKMGLSREINLIEFASRI